MSRVKCEEVPIFCGLVVQKGFDPDRQGPPSAGRFPGLGIPFGDYEFNPNDPRWQRTRSMREIQELIPTGIWPTTGGDHGTS